MSSALPLENDHNVYILGAGFSRDAGLPLVSDFMHRMRDAHAWLVEQERDTEARAVREVLRFRLRAASAAYQVELDLENIETLFSLASASPENLDAEVRLAIAATLDYCEATTPQVSLRAYTDEAWAPPFGPQRWQPIRESETSRTSWRASRYSLYAACMLGLFRFNDYKDGNWARNSFITFNYDTLLERGLEDIGIKPLYFEGQGGRPTPPSVATVEVLKLHGSVNWRLDGGELYVETNYLNVGTRRDGAVPELVPPTWDKRLSGHLAPTWKRAVEKLSTATRIVMIGFSMPQADAHVRFLLAAGLKDNLSLREVRFVNPDLEGIRRRAGEVFRQSSLMHFESDDLTSRGPTTAEYFAGFLRYGQSVARVDEAQLKQIVAD